MSTTSTALRLGFQHLQSGRLDEARRLYRQVLAVEPRNAEAHHQLGLIALAQRQPVVAIACLGSAVACKPDEAEFQLHLGAAYQAAGRNEDALGCYREAGRLNPTLPDLAAVEHNLGAALQREKNYSEAILCHRDAVRLKPDFVEAHSALGAAWQSLGNLDEAVACYRQALAIDPQYASAQFNLATAQMAQGHLDEAQALYEVFVRRMPDNPQAHFALGSCLAHQGRFYESIVKYRRAIALNSNYAEAHFFCGAALLATGQLAAGWPEYEWRSRMPGNAASRGEPLWDGSELAGRRVLIHAEWGLGDTLQLVRYLPLVVARGGTPLVEVQPRLIPLLEQSGFERLIPWGESAVAGCNLRLPMVSLPRVFGTTLETIPAPRAYLAADPRRVERWRDVLADHQGLRIGICWHGAKDSAFRIDRSIPLAEFAPLAQVSGARLISLQQGDGTEELNDLAGRFEVDALGENVDADGAFLDTAAVIKNLDLVVTCDTAMAHLAGALGVPVWVALPQVAEWRWFVERSDSPWYSSMRLFRQRQRGMWGDVFERMAGQLAGADRETFKGRASTA